MNGPARCPGRSLKPWTEGVKSDNYPTYASFAEVVAKRAAAPDERPGNIIARTALLDYEFSLGVAPGKLLFPVMLSVVLPTFRINGGRMVSSFGV